MVCKKSEYNLNADALSRLPIDGQGEKVNDYATSFHLGQLDLCPVDTKTLQKAGEKDQLYSKALKFTQTGWPENVSPDMEVYFKRKLQLTVEDECLMWGRRVVIPEACRGRVLHELHAVHDSIVRMKSLARLHAWWPNIDNDNVRTVEECSLCQNFGTNQFKSISTGRHFNNPEKDCTSILLARSLGQSF